MKPRVRNSSWSYRASILAAGDVGLVGMYGGMISFGKDHYSDAYAQLQRELNDSHRRGPDRRRDGEGRGPRTANGAAKVVEKVASPVVQTVAHATPRRRHCMPNAVPTTLPSMSPVVIAPVAVAVVASADAVGGGHLDYARDIEPIFEANCIKCHNEEKKKGGYRLDAKDRVFAAGESGNVPIVPGKADESRLIKMIEGKGEFADSLMPPKGTPLDVSADPTHPAVDRRRRKTTPRNESAISDFRFEMTSSLKQRCRRPTIAR